MRQFKFITLALLIITLFAVIGSGASAERLLESRADFLRLDSDRIYLWVDNPVTVNQDFSIEIERQKFMIYRAGVSDVLGKVVVSSVLPLDIVELLQTKTDCTFRVLLESDIICDSLIIAMPANLRDLWLDTVFIANAKPPIRYLFRYYDDMKEVEIAAKLRQVDLLIMPQFELPDAALFADSPVLLEWNLLGATIKNDLLATALNDCVRGLLTDSSERAYSSLINQDQLETIFPKNTPHARELFAQSRKSNEKFDCYFPGYKMYPRLAEIFNSALDSCSGRKLLFRDTQPQALSLLAVPLGMPADSLNNCGTVIRVLAKSIRDALDIKGSTYLDSCLLGTVDLSGCCETLSRAIAESVRLVPLGRSQLAIRHFDHVRWLKRDSGAARFSDYYTVKQ